MAAIILKRARRPEDTGPAGGELHTFNDVRARLRQPRNVSDWSDVQVMTAGEPWKFFGGMVQEVMVDRELEKDEVRVRGFEREESVSKREILRARESLFLPHHALHQKSR